MLFILGIFMLIGLRSKNNDGEITITNLSKKLLEQKDRLEKEVLNSKDYKKLTKQREEAKKNIDKDEQKPKLFVLEFNGDEFASQIDELREEITAILTLATQNDEVLLKIESPGGYVYGYGLGASQLRRLKDNHIPLTVAVDKVAASGGYMMACVADNIVAAPFAALGSIGVVVEMPNFNRWLKRRDIDFNVMTAGEYKRTLTVFGENTPEGKEKLQQELEEVHRLFKSFVKDNRPIVDIDHVSTGEVWYGVDAKNLKLIDEIATSDDLILRQIEQKDVVLVRYEKKKSVIKRVGQQAETSVMNVFYKIFNWNRKIY